MRIAAVAVIVLIAGCASGAAPVTSPEAPFDLRLMPAIAFQGADVRLTCHVPESLGRGVIRLALEDVAVTGPKPVEHIQEVLLVQRVECGQWQATCRVVAEGGTRFAERVLEVRGGMCNGQDLRPARH